MKTVYLAGPITNLSWGEATDWREYVIKALAESNIKGLSPLRCKNYLEKETKIADSYEHFPLSTGKAITTRDRWDVTRCDMVFVNLLGAKTVSIGTVMEIAWANAFNKPIVLVMEKDNIHKHSMLLEVSGFITDNLDSAIEMVEALLS